MTSLASSVVEITGYITEIRVNGIPVPLPLKISQHQQQQQQEAGATPSTTTVTISSLENVRVHSEKTEHDNIKAGEEPSLPDEPLDQLTNQSTTPDSGLPESEDSTPSLNLEVESQTDDDDNDDEGTGIEVQPPSLPPPDSMSEFTSLDDTSLPTEYAGLPFTSTRQQQIGQMLKKLSRILNIEDSLTSTSDSSETDKTITDGSEKTTLKTITARESRDDALSTNTMTSITSLSQCDTVTSTQNSLLLSTDLQLTADSLTSCTTTESQEASLAAAYYRSTCDSQEAESLLDSSASTQDTLQLENPLASTGTITASVTSVDDQSSRETVIDATAVKSPKTQTISQLLQDDDKAEPEQLVVDNEITSPSVTETQNSLSSTYNKIPDNEDKFIASDSAISVPCLHKQLDTQRPKSPKNTTVHFNSTITEIYMDTDSGESSSFQKIILLPSPNITPQSSDEAIAEEQTDIKSYVESFFNGTILAPLFKQIPDKQTEARKSRAAVKETLLSKVSFSPDDEDSINTSLAEAITAVTTNPLIPFQSYQADSRSTRKADVQEVISESGENSNTISSESRSHIKEAWVKGTVYDEGLRKLPQLSSPSCNKDKFFSSLEFSERDDTDVKAISTDVNMQSYTADDVTVVESIPSSISAMSAVSDSKFVHSVQLPVQPCQSRIQSISTTNISIPITNTNEALSNVNGEEKILNTDIGSSASDVIDVKPKKCDDRRTHRRQGSYTLDEPSPVLVRAIKRLNDDETKMRSKRLNDGEIKTSSRSSNYQKEVVQKKLDYDISTQLDQPSTVDIESEGKREHLNKYLQNVEEYGSHFNEQGSSVEHSPDSLGSACDYNIQTASRVSSQTMTTAQSSVSSSAAVSMPSFTALDWNRLSHMSELQLMEMQATHFETMRSDILQDQKTQLDSMFLKQQQEQISLQQEFERQIQTLQEQQKTVTKTKDAAKANVVQNTTKPSVSRRGNSVANRLARSSMVAQSRGNERMDTVTSEQACMPPNASVASISSDVRAEASVSSQPSSVYSYITSPSQAECHQNDVSLLSTFSQTTPKKHLKFAAIGATDMAPEQENYDHPDHARKWPTGDTIPHVAISTQPKPSNVAPPKSLALAGLQASRLSPSSHFPLHHHHQSAALMKPVVRSPVKPYPPTRNRQRVVTPAQVDYAAMHACFCRVSAVAKSYLTRRLLGTPKVQTLVKTIRDTREFALNFQTETPVKKGGLSLQDRDLLERIIAQLQAALLDIHEIFFELTISEQMALIANSRQLEREKHYREMTGQPVGDRQLRRRISAATLKAIERKQKALQEVESTAVPQTRPQTAPPATSSPKTSRSMEHRALRPIQGQISPIREDNYDHRCLPERPYTAPERTNQASNIPRRRKTAHIPVENQPVSKPARITSYIDKSSKSKVSLASDKPWR